MKNQRTIRALFLPLCLLYSLLRQFNEFRLSLEVRGRKVPGTPLVVVGALKMGGSGKTSAAAALAREFARAGLRVALMAYWIRRPRTPEKWRKVSMSWEDTSDEAMWLHRVTGCDVYVTRNRRGLWEYLSGTGKYDVLFSDDGFQDPRLQPALKILLMDSHEHPQWGNLFPAGPYWETWKAAKRADWVLRGPIIRNSGSTVRELHRILRGPSVAKPEQGPYVFQRILDVPSGISGTRVVVSCALGDNQSFVESLSLLGMTCVALVTKKNHRPFSRSEIRGIREKYPHLPILTTEKDAVKAPAVFEMPGVAVVRQRVKFSPEFIRELFLKLKFGTFYDSMIKHEKRKWSEPVSL